MKVVTVLKSGGEYGPQMVTAIQKMCEKHITLHYKFICYTDMNVPNCICKPLKHGWEGWYSKMEIYQEAGPILYIDLDTIIVGNLDELIQKAMNYQFIILRDFYRGRRNPYAMQSSIMFWNTDMTFLYDQYKANPIKIFGGDQILLEKAFSGPKKPWVAFWQDIVEGICSYKVDIIKRGVKPTDKIVCFHGKPRPWNQSKIRYA